MPCSLGSSLFSFCDYFRAVQIVEIDCLWYNTSIMDLQGNMIKDMILNMQIFGAEVEKIRNPLDITSIAEYDNYHFPADLREHMYSFIRHETNTILNKGSSFDEIHVFSSINWSKGAKAVHTPIAVFITGIG